MSAGLYKDCPASTWPGGHNVTTTLSPFSKCHHTSNSGSQITKKDSTFFTEVSPHSFEIFFAVKYVLVKHVLSKRKIAALIPAVTPDGTKCAAWAVLTKAFPTVLGGPLPVLTNVQCLLQRCQGPAHTRREMTRRGLLCRLTDHSTFRTQLQRDERDGTTQTKGTSD